MTLKERLRRTIKAAIDNYDFEEAIENAVDRIDIDDLVNDRMNKRVEKIDIDPIIEDFVRDYIEEELDDINIEAEMLRAVEDIL
ncbi:MAG: hypothetical protein J6V80_03250 [Clostridia bacterium]|nr:hypothetical protein [Clostridia bacterium]